MNDSLLTLENRGVPCSFTRVYRVVVACAPWLPALPLQLRNIAIRNRKGIDDN
ncbi:MAG: hypothetical protein ACREXO_03380 [Advenella sp.]